MTFTQSVSDTSEMLSELLCAYISHCDQVVSCAVCTTWVRAGSCYNEDKVGKSCRAVECLLLGAF